MPASARVSYGNLIYDSIISPTSRGNAALGTITWSATTVAATTTSELTAVIPGLLPGDAIDLYLQSAAMTTGLTIANVRVSVPDTLAVTWVNSTGGAVTVPTATWIANISRPESGVNGLLPNFV